MCDVKCTPSKVGMVMITAFLAVILDLITKTLYVTRHRNYGVLFDIPLPPAFTISLSICAVLFVFWFFLQRIRSDWRAAFGIGLLIGGALGNLYDRIILGFVRDWILFFERSAFNFADIAIAMGLFILLWRMRRPNKS